MYFSDVIPEDTIEQLSNLKEDSLLSFFRSLPLLSFLCKNLSDQSTAVIHRIYDNLIAAVDETFALDASPIKSSSSVADLVVFLRQLYVTSSPHLRDLSSLRDDISRNWSVREKDDQGTATVAWVIDPVFTNESTHAQVRHISTLMDPLPIYPKNLHPVTLLNVTHII